LLNVQEALWRFAIGVAASLTGYAATGVVYVAVFLFMFDHFMRLFSRAESVSSTAGVFAGFVIAACAYVGAAVAAYVFAGTLL